MKTPRLETGKEQPPQAGEQPDARQTPSEGGEISGAFVEEQIAGRHIRPFDQLSGEEAFATVQKLNASEEELDIDGKKLCVHDLKPERETGRPLVFVSGYYAEGDSMRQMMYDMHLSGRRVLAFNSYHGIEPSAAFMAQHHDRIEELKQADPDAPIEPQLRKAAALIEMLDRKGLQQVDIFAHSEGTIVATIAACLRPDLFAKKAFLAPSGMIGHVSKVTVMMRKVRDGLDTTSQRLEHMLAEARYGISSRIRGLLAGSKQEPRQAKPMAWRQISTRYGNDPMQDLSPVQRREAGRTYREWVEAQGTYLPSIHREYVDTADKQHLDSELESLVRRQLDHLLPIMGTDDLVVGACERDRLYPPKEVRKHAEAAGVRRFMVIRDATHNAHHFQPDKVTAFISRAIGIPLADLSASPASVEQRREQVAGNTDEVLKQSV